MVRSPCGFLRPTLCIACDGRDDMVSGRLEVHVAAMRSTMNIDCVIVVVFAHYSFDTSIFPTISKAQRQGCLNATLIRWENHMYEGL